MPRLGFNWGLLHLPVDDRIIDNRLDISEEIEISISGVLS